MYNFLTITFISLLNMLIHIILRKNLDIYKFIQANNSASVV